jgi:GNAT superfamily N-acetyltransferase
MLRTLIDDLDGALRATCLLIVGPNLLRGARPFGLIENVVTHAAHRRGGWGRAVLRAALSAAWAAGCYKVTLVTGARDPAVLRFYGAAGFHATGHQVFEARPRDFA